MISPSSRCFMRPGTDPCLRVIVTGLQDATCRLGLGATHHRATKAHPVGATFIGLVCRPPPAMLAPCVVACRQTRAAREGVPVHPRWVTALDPRPSR